MQTSCDLGSFCLNGLLFVYFGSHFFLFLWVCGGWVGVFLVVLLVFVFLVREKTCSWVGAGRILKGLGKG